MRKCWICGENADSEEHKFKGSDLKRNYGKKFEAFYISGSTIPINSYKDKVLKFPKVICINCNNNRTRPHDDAYDLFIEYCQLNYDYLLNSKFLDFKKIYGDNWKEQKLNLYRYFAKHSGCKIKTSEFDTNIEDLADFVKGLDKIKSFVLMFELKIFVKHIHEYYNKTHKYVHLFNGPTTYFGKNKNELNFGGWISNNWITINWVYSKSIINSKQTDFENQYEELNIKDLDNYEKSFTECEDPESIITYIEYGKLDTLEKRAEHFKKIIE